MNIGQYDEEEFTTMISKFRFLYCSKGNVGKQKFNVIICEGADPPKAMKKVARNY